MTRKQKSPAFPLYTKDYDTDEKVILMDLAQEGMFNRLMRHQWREGSIPAATAELAVICRVPLAKFQRIWTGRVASCFEPIEGRPDRLANRKVEAVRTEQDAFLAKRSEAGRKGNAARWPKGTKEDTPAIATGSQPDRKAIATVSPAVAVAVAVPVAAAGTEAAAPDDGARKGAFLTPEARAQAIRDGKAHMAEIARAGEDPGEALKRCSLIPKSKWFLVSLDAPSKDEHLLRTVHALRDEAEKLRRGGAGEKDGLLTPAEHERRRRA